MPEERTVVLSEVWPEVVAGRWFMALCEGGMPRDLASKCMRELTRLLHEQPSDRYYVIVEEDGDTGRLEFQTEPPRPGQKLAFTVPVRKWKRSVMRAIEAERDAAPKH